MDQDLLILTVSIDIVASRLGREAVVAIVVSRLFLKPLGAVGSQLLLALRLWSDHSTTHAGWKDVGCRLCGQVEDFPLQFLCVAVYFNLCFIYIRNTNPDNV